MRHLDRSYLRALVVLAIAVGVHTVFCLSLHYHFLNPYFYVTAHAKGQAGPFFGIYQAGVNLLDGESIYASEGYRTPSNIAVPYYHFYRYLPFVSYVAAIVSRVLKPWPAYWIWVILNEILLGVCIVMTLRLRKFHGAAAIAVAGFWLIYSPMYAELYMGQFCFTMTFFIFLMLYPHIAHGSREPAGGNHAPERGKAAAPVAGASSGHRPDAAAGAPLDIARRGERFIHLASVSWIASLLVKSFTVLYTPTLVRLGKKKLVAAGVALVALTSAPYFATHIEDLRWFLHLNLHPLPPRLTGGCFGFSGFLRDVCTTAFPVSTAGALNFGVFDVTTTNVPVLAIAGAIVMATLYVTLRQKRIDPLGNIALWTLTFFLVFKDVWEYHYVMLIPLFVAYYLETRSKFVLVLFVLLAVPTPFFLYDVPASDDPQRFWSAPLSLMHHSFKAVPTFLFYVWVLKREWKRIAPWKPQPIAA